MQEGFCNFIDLLKIQTIKSAIQNFNSLSSAENKMTVILRCRNCQNEVWIRCDDALERHLVSHKSKYFFLDCE